MSRARPRNRSRRGRVVVVAVLAAAVVVAAGALFLTSRWDDDASEVASSTTPPAPSTSAEPQEGAATEETDGTPETVPATGSAVETGSSAPDGPAEVGVVTTYAAWDPTASAVVAGGYVPDVIEDGGSCTLTLTRDGVVLSGESTASADATTTDCGELRVASPELTSGPWDAVLGYASAGASGQSAPFSVVIP